MIILHQRMRAKPERCDEVLSALDAIVPGARATQGVVKLDIARDLRDPELFIATGVYEDGAALERQESAAEVHDAVSLFGDALAAPPERTIYDAAVDPVLV
jgi:quinol monooxygenase YgiN